MTVTDWIKDNYAEHGREFVVNGIEVCRDITDHQSNSSTWERQVRRIIRELEGGSPLPDQSHQVRTLDDALEYHDVPEGSLELRKVKFNTWGSATNPNQQVSVEMGVKKLELDVDSVTEAFKAAIKSSPLSKKHITNHRDEGELCIEISLPDMHHGKIIYEEITGSADYNIEASTSLFMDAVVNLIDGSKASRFVLPIGEDYFNVDNMQRATTKLTPQQNEDPRHMFRIGLETSFRVIDYLAEKGNVFIPVICGNHDKLLSFAMGMALYERYRNDDRVTVDASPAISKSYGEGDWGVVFHHAAMTKMNDLAWIFPDKFPELWSATRFREVHSGHLHHNKITDEINGVRVILLPSLVPYDDWHDENNYRSLREGQAHIWHKRHGKVGLRYYHPYLSD